MEYEYNEPVKKGHSTLALVFGILSILITFFLGMLLGMIGIIPAVILAVLAIVLGITSIRASGHGKGGIITGVIGILLALMIGGVVMSIGTYLKSEEIKRQIPTLSEYADSSWMGVIGLFWAMDRDNVDMDQLNAELRNYSDGAGSAAAVTVEMTEKTA